MKTALALLLSASTAVLAVPVRRPAPAALPPAAAAPPPAPPQPGPSAPSATPRATESVNCGFKGEHLKPNTIWGRSPKGNCVPCFALAPMPCPAQPVCAVKYFASAPERAPFKIHFVNKRLFSARNELFDTTQQLEIAVRAGFQKPTYLAATMAENRLGARPAIWVLDGAGDLYITVLGKPGELNHSSLLGGANVVSAGEIVVKNGEITVLNNQSGHYHPTDASLDRAIAYLRTKALLSSRLKVEYWQEATNNRPTATASTKAKTPNNCDAGKAVPVVVRPLGNPVGPPVQAPVQAAVQAPPAQRGPPPGARYGAQPAPAGPMPFAYIEDVTNYRD